MKATDKFRIEALLRDFHLKPEVRERFLKDPDSVMREYGIEGGKTPHPLQDGRTSAPPVSPSPCPWHKKGRVRKTYKFPRVLNIGQSPQIFWAKLNNVETRP
jgi:hypothetical protein